MKSSQLISYLAIFYTLQFTFCKILINAFKQKIYDHSSFLSFQINHHFLRITNDIFDFHPKSFKIHFKSRLWFFLYILQFTFFLLHYITFAPKVILILNLNYFCDFNDFGEFANFFLFCDFCNFCNFPIFVLFHILVNLAILLILRLLYFTIYILQVHI